MSRPAWCFVLLFALVGQPHPPSPRWGEGLGVRGCYASAPPAVMTAAQKKQRAANLRLYGKLQAQDRAGEFDSALLLCRRLLKSEKAMGGPATTDVAFLLGRLAQLCEKNKDWKGSVAARRERLRVVVALQGNDHPR